MNKKELKQIREKMIRAVETRFSGVSRVRCPSLKKMAGYINQIFPTLKAEVISWSEYKGRKAGRIFVSGQSYFGNKLIITDKKTGEIIKEHSSTETYRESVEIAEFILNLEEDKNLTKINTN